MFKKCREDGVVHLPVADVTNRMRPEVQTPLAIAAANKQCPMDMELPAKYPVLLLMVGWYM